MTRSFLFFFFKDFIYLFLEGKRGRKRGKHQCVVTSRAPTLQASALTGNWSSYPLVHRPALSPLSHASQTSRHTSHTDIYIYTHISFNYFPSINTNIVSISWLLWMMLLWTWEYKSLFEIMILFFLSVQLRWSTWRLGTLSPTQPKICI